MTDIFLGLGSNTDKHRNLCAGLDALALSFGELKISSVYESLPVGFDGRNFYNLVVAAKTELTLEDLSRRLKQIEDANGRLRDGPKFSPRTLDIDILTYGAVTGKFGDIELPRDEILFNAFVLKPLAEIAPDALLPGTQTRYATLWQNASIEQQLWPVSFIWQGRELTQS
ncbi:2-amino-4-hydroxy-6-hydroxymethyldihydropteridine diphosphokinase [Simiduia curdlanivorans]|uniref:2-amino-4-hydroxy-6-hydroxymethyldihydropteridine diphosphokinase n=1 Tax=Simiduia curdlanivorans TaxID=1492769 RepID=A0ABV8V2P5_9GAMM|nr:2-amino-4-hydroxy-6-hydroxymethyldihydropteridine diphosphokinase [Simiduia curdlanivorans]MDN3637582.1 2-amino-4-hydroxy-6-hydroxymethyldihydropteridine diphosphokinase [Simiduia curdlanivorans]